MNISWVVVGPIIFVVTITTFIMSGVITFGDAPSLEHQAGVERGGTFIMVGEGESADTIKYGDKYLPLDQLIVSPEEECGGEHYHAANGSVVATDGTDVPDPGLKCGYGQVSSVPHYKLDIESTDEAGFSEVGGLEIEEQPIEYRNGSEDTHVRKLNGLNKYANIHFKWRTATGDLVFWNWILSGIKGEEEPEMKMVDPPSLTVPAREADIDVEEMIVDIEPATIRPEEF